MYELNLYLWKSICLIYIILVKIICKKATTN